MSSLDTVQTWPAYAAYKDSGVEWLGEIPAHWRLTAIKHLVRAKITDGPHETPEFLDEGIPFLSVDSIKNGTLDFEGCRFISSAAHAEYRRKCAPTIGDLLLGKAASTGKLAIVDVDFEFSVWSPLALIQPQTKKVDSKFLYYSISSLAVQDQIELLCNKNTQKNIAMGDIETLLVFIPSLSEQQAIAAFLDRETAKVDALIARKERLIELLQEKRAALISHAVTKGLDADAPMKDSGVEWLGEIPAHWQVKQLKYLADVRSGVAKGRDLSLKETIDLPYLRVANVQDGWIDLTYVATITVGTDEVERYSLQPGDVLMNEGGDFDKLGRGCVWQGQIDPCLHQNHVFAVRPLSRINPEWINTITLTRYAKQYFILNSKQSTNLASISSTNIRELPIVCPPEHEQIAILKHLASITAKLDAIIDKTRQHIKKLREYRTALISAAVTGKIDVRNSIHQQT